MGDENGADDDRSQGPNSNSRSPDQDQDQDQDPPELSDALRNDAAVLKGCEALLSTLPEEARAGAPDDTICLRDILIVIDARLPSDVPMSMTHLWTYLTSQEQHDMFRDLAEHPEAHEGWLAGRRETQIWQTLQRLATEEVVADAAETRERARQRAADQLQLDRGAESAIGSASAAGPESDSDADDQEPEMIGDGRMEQPVMLFRTADSVRIRELSDVDSRGELEVFATWLSEFATCDIDGRAQTEASWALFDIGQVVDEICRDVGVTPTNYHLRRYLETRTRQSVVKDLKRSERCSTRWLTRAGVADQIWQVITSLPECEPFETAGQDLSAAERRQVDEVVQPSRPSAARATDSSTGGWS